MKDYSKMSDFEINKAVAACLGAEVQEWNGKIFGGVERKIDNVTSVIGVIDYCNNPSDAWPIIVSMISGGCIVQMLKAGVIVTLQGGGRIQVMDKNPLRVAMIVFLMMKDEEK